MSIPDRFLALAVPVLLACGSSSALATTYYISESTGADTNTTLQAQSKSTPWAHLPGMASCTSNCGAYSPVAGDRFILMGCDVWVPSDFQISWSWSGSSGSPIYIGVDKSWYNTASCPAGWNRPVFDGQGTNPNLFLEAATNNATSWVTLDNIEMKRQGGCTAIYNFNAVSNWVLENLYIHAWFQAVDANNAVIQFTAGNLVTTSVIDGSDATPPGVTCSYFYPTPPNVTNSVLHDMPNGLVGYAYPGGSTLTWSGNDIYNINASNGGSHGNAMETVGGGTYYVYNNRIRSMGNCGGCESSFFGNSGETDYVFNNLFYDLGTLSVSNSQTPSVGGETGGHMYYWNNTIVAVDAQSCINNGSQGAVGSDVTVQNIHCIQGEAGGSVTDFTATSPNLLQTNAQADANASPQFDRYTDSETYPYSPVASTNSSVGAGANLASNCAGPLASLCSDIAYYVQGTVNGVVQAVPGRTANPRPMDGGAWDVGAYQFAPSTGSSSTSVSATTGVTAGATTGTGASTASSASSTTTGGTALGSSAGSSSTGSAGSTGGSSASQSSGSIASSTTGSSEATSGATVSSGCGCGTARDGDWLVGLLLSVGLATARRRRCRPALVGC